MRDKNIISENSEDLHKDQHLTFDSESGELIWTNNSKDKQIPMDYFKKEGFF